MFTQTIKQPIQARRPLALAKAQLCRVRPRTDEGTPQLIALATVGASVAGTTSIVAPKPASPAVGQMLLFFMAHKYPAVTAATPSGWTLVAQEPGGIGSSGADAGAIVLSIWKREIDQAYIDEVATDVTVTLTGGNSAAGQIVAHDKPAAMAWDIAWSKGVATVPALWSVTMDDDIDIRAGDLLWDVEAVNGDAGGSLAAPTMANTGAAFSPFLSTRNIPGCRPGGSIAPGFGRSTANGDDLVLRAQVCPILGGKSIGKSSFTVVPATPTANCPTGPTVYLRMRAV